jgi:hypothetical protein
MVTRFGAVNAAPVVLAKIPFLPDKRKRVYLLNNIV